MANFTSDINWRPAHYFRKYWADNADPYVGNLPFTTPGPPLNWAMTALLLVYFIRVSLPKWMDSKAPFDIKPWALCLNGFAFGGYVTGILTVMVPTNFFMDCFDCKAYSATTDRYPHLVVKHFAYAYIYAKLFDFLIPIFCVLGKKKGVTTFHLQYLVTAFLGSVCLVKINPGGIFIFVALADGVFCVVLYSYLTFAAASRPFRPSRTWKWAVFLSKMLTWSLILMHSSYFLSVGNCGDPVIKLSLVVISLLVLLLFPYDWFTTDALSTERRRVMGEEGTAQMFPASKLFHDVKMKEKTLSK